MSKKANRQNVGRDQPAAQRAERGSVPCNIHQGTAKDARIFGMTANDRHGLRMSRADKRACVEWLLDNGGKMAQREIAEKAGVSRRLVQNVVAQRNPASIAGKAHIAPYTPKRGDSSSNDRPESPQPGEHAASAPPDDGNKVQDEPLKSADLGKCPNCGKSKWDEDG